MSNEYLHKTIVDYLEQCKNKTVSLDEIFKLCPGTMKFVEIVRVLLALVEEQVLEEVSGKNRYFPDPRLCLKYKLHLNYLHKADLERIQQEIFRERLHSALDLSFYYKEGIAQWQLDAPYLRKLSGYISANGLPKEEMSDQERSYRIFGDEKFLLEGGRRILQHCGLAEKMKIRSVADPLMLAVNAKRLAAGGIFRHMIVENKATYYGLLDSFLSTDFTTLVFGSGWKIVGNLKQLPGQIGLEGANHEYYYFGDFDYEGIAIWYALNEMQPVQPAVEFYRRFLMKPPSRGKENQLPRKEPVVAFLRYFPEAEAKRWAGILLERGYYPQETLDKVELAVGWRSLCVR